MNFFPSPPDDLDESMPLEPMRLKIVGSQDAALKKLLGELVSTHPTKLKKDEAHRLRDTYRQILLNVIYNSIRKTYTGIPRNNDAFKPTTYWNKLGLTYRLTIAALDRLVAEGYISLHKGFYNPPAGFGRLSRLYGLEKLSEAVNAELIGQHLMLEDEESTLVLKGFDYDASSLVADHPDILRLKIINDFLKDFSWKQKSPIRLIYSGGPLRGGRLYSRFQNLPKTIRADLTINRKPTVELDYKSNHLMMLLAMSGKEFPADPYLVIANKANATREQAKAFFNACLSAQDAEQGFDACKKHRINKALFIKLETAFTTEYSEIRLYSDLGSHLQSIEGQIALDIMLDGAKAGIPVLPVHDSFITTTEHEEWLREKMIFHWKGHLNVTRSTKVEKKA